MSWANGEDPKRKKSAKKKTAPLARKSPRTKKVPARTKKPTGKRKRPSDGGAKTGVALDPTIDLWLQQPKESGPAYQGFCAYRDFQPHERTLVKVQALLKKSPSTVERWSARWSWVLRCRAWDVEKERAMLEASLGDIVRMRKAQAKGASIIQRALVAPALAIVEELERDPEFLLRGVRDSEGKVVFNRVVELMGLVVATSRMFPAVADVERLARGEPTAITDHRITDGRQVADDTMSDPETRRQALELFERIHGVAGMPALPNDTNGAEDDG